MTLCLNSLQIALQIENTKNCCDKVPKGTVHVAERYNI